MTKIERMKYLTRNIILGMVLGFGVGVLFNLIGTEGFLRDYIIEGVLTVGGGIFIATLKLLVVPLVFVSLVCGTAALDDIRKLGRVGGKTLGLYLVTTAVAISIAIIMAMVVSPGVGFNLEADVTFTAKEAPPFTQVLIDIFPTNPVKAMAEGNMLQIIVFAILFGFAMMSIGQKGQAIHNLFKDLNEVIMKMVTMMMLAAPVGVFCLVTKVFALQGFDAIVPLAKYFFVVVAVLLIHALVVYSGMLKVLTGLNPIQFLKNIREAQIFAFSTASSNATLPITLETVEHKLGVDNSIASFSIPLGATINMDGTAIMQGVATVFIAQAYGIELGAAEFLAVVVTATLASIGTAGVPGVGLITLAMVLRQVNLPVEGIGLIIGVDRLLDMMRTAVNVTGDAMVSCVVAKTEGQFSQKVFDSDVRED